MKAFENKTNLKNEPAVKKGKYLPSDAVNLGWFYGEDVTPEKHLSVTDLSYLVPENYPPVVSAEVDTMMYADEFGTLRYVRSNQEAGQFLGSPIVNNSQVSLSNLIISNLDEGNDFNYTGRIDEFETLNFAHSYYVSRYYALLSPLASPYAGIRKTVPVRQPSLYNIRVVDQSGNNYVDDSGQEKYKILLEKYTNTRIRSVNFPTQYEGLDLYRIVVLLEAADPNELYLIYDKYERDAEDIPYNPFFGFKEKVNAVPYYKYVVEESEVIDPSATDRNIYSTQLFSFKENVLLKNKVSNYGWKVHVPRKALQDPRTFQSFNWRILAKITYDFSQVRNVYADAENDRATLNVGVLYSGDVNQAKNAYVFHNLEESVFNLQNYLFSNPLRAANADKSEKTYWLVNIDDQSINYDQFDLLIWTPIQPITTLQGQIVARLLDKNVSVFVDASVIANQSSTGLSNLNVDMSVGNSSSGSIVIDSVYKNANESLNAWSLSDYDETSSIPSYSIFGKRKDILNNNNSVVVKTFTGTPGIPSASKALVTIGSNTAMLRTVRNTSNTFSASTTICVHPFLELINDKILGDGTQVSNNGARNIYPLGTVGSQRSQHASSVVGPNKLFYNILSDVNKNKVNAYAANNTYSKSTVLWNVSPWRNSWTINGQLNSGKVTVLSDFEKQEYNFSTKTELGSTTSKFCRQISPSISQLMSADFEQTFNGGDAQNIINSDFSNVEFYMECTNKNVEFLNFTDVTASFQSGSEPLLGQGSILNNIFKLNTAASNQIKDRSPVSIDAVSKVLSREFNFNSVKYPYVIMGSSQYEDRTGSTIKTPTDFLPASQNTHDYSFDFKTKISINEIRKTVNIYRVNWSAPFSADVKTLARFSGITFKPKQDGPVVKGYYANAKLAEGKQKIRKSFSPFNGYNYSNLIYSRTDIAAVDQDSTTDTANNFHYTGDIDAGNRWDEYKLSSNSVSEINKRGNKISESYIQAAITNAIVQNGWEDFMDGEDLDHPLWSRDVYYGSAIYSFRDLFKKWLVNTYTVAKRVQTFSPSVLDFRSDIEVLQSLNMPYSNSEVATQFIQAYPSLYFVDRTTVGSSPNRMEEAYTKYIQYTLKNIFKKENIIVDGKYGYQTHSLVKRFQKQKSQSFVDGIVDSETKSVLALFWLKLHRDNYPLFEVYRNAAPAGTKRFINAAVTYGDISNIIDGREYRRISFTGVAGPTQIVDYIMIKIPETDVNQKIHSIKIKSGQWRLEVDGVHLYGDVVNIPKVYGKKFGEDKPIPGSTDFGQRLYSPLTTDQDVNIPANSEAIIKFSEEGIADARWVGIRVIGKKLNDPKYGPNAEGYSLTGVEFEISTKGPDSPAVNGTDSTFTGRIDGTISGYTDINSDEESVITFSTFANILNTPNATITAVNIDKLSFSAIQEQAGVNITKNISYTIPDPTRINRLNEGISFKYDDILGDQDLPIETEPLTSMFSFDIGTPSKGQCLKISGATQSSVSSSDFSISEYKDNSYVVKTTNGIDYESIETSPETLVQNYWLADADNIISRQNNIKTVNVRDGVTVLTNANGQPIGFPDFNSYRPSGSNSVINYGFLNLIWNRTEVPPYGLDWGFLYIEPSTKVKKFLGKKISYLEYMQYGTNNVFIGVNAFDSDNSSSTTNNIVEFQSRYGQLSESYSPSRYICPVYSVKVKNRSKISISAPPKNLSKFDTWFINVGVGRFIKKINIPLNHTFPSSSWLNNYKGKDLSCHYDTTNIKVPYSSIFGTGHYDIHEENPVIVSDDTIAVRHGSFVVAQEQYDKRIVETGEYTDASPIVPWVFISIKDNNNNWIPVSRKEILDYDKNNGTIKFKKEIVPTSNKDIKISYTIKNENLMIHQINGQVIPINPYLSLEQNKPIFIYLKPLRCEELVNGVYETASGFSAENAVQFTTDSNIFDERSNKYDPLALHIATINVNNLYDFNNIKVEDLRIRGGGVKPGTVIKSEFEKNQIIASYTDMHTGSGYVHANGGYVIIQIPKDVIKNFTSKQEVYNIVRNNLTAGVSFDIQDVDGTDWRTITNV